MQQVLVYADSLSWGIIPHTRLRLNFSQRWPGALEQRLNANGQDVRVIENCLNGRRTAWDDPFKPGRDGSQGLAQVIEMHSPLSLVILLLGSNDFQGTHDLNAWMSAQGMAKLIQCIRQAPIEPGMPSPKILVVAPPKIVNPNGPIAAKFQGAEKRCIGLSDELDLLAASEDCLFFDSNDVLESAGKDGIHLDAEQHLALAQALEQFILQEKVLG